MKVLFTSLFLLFCYTAVAQGSIFSKRKDIKDTPQLNIEQLDEDYGFRDIKLESDYSSFKNMVLTDDEGSTKHYTRSTEELNMESFKIHSIKYCFYKTKLMMITITTKGLDNSRGLLAMIQAQYGKVPQGKGTSYSVIGEQTKLSYFEHPKTHEGKLIIMSLPLTATMFNDERAIASE